MTADFPDLENARYNDAETRLQLVLKGMLGRVLGDEDCQYHRSQDDRSSWNLGKESIPPGLCDARSLVEAGSIT